jgi:uroporphyrinogen decarboxylase
MLYLDAARCLETPRPPIWIMRQAGRYMPVYRELRDRYGFMEMIHNPELAATVTMQPIEAFGPDAAILFSDILVVAEALGQTLTFIEKKGPVLTPPLLSTTLATVLRNPEDALLRLDYVPQAIRLIRDRLPAETALIGFAGAPFTVACYMCEGGSSPDLKATKKMMISDPETFRHVIETVTVTTVGYLKSQVDAGVHALQLFDTWAGLLSWDDFQTWIVPFVSRIIAELKAYSPTVPITYFCKGMGGFYPLALGMSPDVLGCDWQSDIVGIKREIGSRAIAVQGNLDPMLLYAAPEVIRDRAQRLIASLRPYSGHIFNLGHGILPDMSPEHVRTLVDTVKAWK